MTNQTNAADICKRDHELNDEQTLALGKWAATAKAGEIFYCPICGKPYTQIVSASKTNQTSK